MATDSAEEFRQRAGEFGVMKSDAFDDLSVFACNPDELGDVWLVNDPTLAIHPRPRPAPPHASS